MVPHFNIPCIGYKSFLRLPYAPFSLFTARKIPYITIAMEGINTF